MVHDFYPTRCMFSIPSTRHRDRNRTTRWINIIYQRKSWEILYIFNSNYNHHWSNTVFCFLRKNPTREGRFTCFDTSHFTRFLLGLYTRGHLGLHSRSEIPNWCSKWVGKSSTNSLSISHCVQNLPKTSHIKDHVNTHVTKLGTVNVLSIAFQPLPLFNKTKWNWRMWSLGKGPLLSCER